MPADMRIKRNGKRWEIPARAPRRALFRFLGIGRIGFRGKGRPRGLNYAHRRDESPNELSPGESPLSLFLSVPSFPHSLPPK